MQRYEYQPYPKYLYHASEKPRIVHTPDQHAALGDGWHESPADVPAPGEPAAVAIEPPAKKLKAAKT